MLSKYSPKFKQFFIHFAINKLIVLKVKFFFPEFLSPRTMFIFFIWRGTMMLHITEYLFTNFVKSLKVEILFGLALNFLHFQKVMLVLNIFLALSTKVKWWTFQTFVTNSCYWSHIATIANCSLMFDSLIGVDNR